jgi:hypothetical protein
MATQSLSLKVIRPEDLVVLRLDFIDVDVTPGVPPTVKGQAGARLVVQFQPQHVAEQAFWQSGKSAETKEEQAARQNPPPAAPSPAPPAGSDPLPDPGRVLSRLAGASRLAFTIPAGTTFPLSLPDILEAIRTLPLVAPGVAAYETPAGCAGVPVAFLPLFFLPAPPKIAPPGARETAIEAPWRLFLSPDSMATWDHAAEAVEHDGRVELWHTRLGTRRANGDPRVRGVWSPDFRENDLQPHANEPFRTSLDARDRNELVHLTSNYYIDNFTPLSVDTRKFMLTTLGVWLDLQGDWTPPLFSETRSLTVEQWRHVATMGRDHYVRVVYAGYLFPFGHRASLVKITERKFAFRDTGFVAYNFQRMFILVRQRTRTYVPRDMPFREVEILTRATPDLEKPEFSSVIAPPSQDAFWPRITLPDGTGTEFPFHLRGRDWENRETEFTTPLIFVSKDADLSIDPVITAYNKPATVPLRSPRMSGHRVSFAPSAKPSDTALESLSITFASAKLASDTPHFRPLMQEAEVDLPAVKQLLDKSVPSVIELEPTFVAPSAGEIGNTGDVFARIKPGPKIEFAHDKSGGLVAPDMSITSVSRSLGPMGGTPTDIVKGLLNPADAFKGVKLLGGIELKDIIAPLVTTNASSDAGGKFPQLLTVREPNAIRTTYTWTVPRADLRKEPTGIFQPGDSASFVLTAVARKPLDGGPPAFVTTGTLSDFGIVLLPGKRLASLEFDFIKFTAEAGKKLDTAVQFRGIVFDDILKFVNELQKVIPMDGFNDPPSVQLMTAPPGVNVGFSLGLPTIGIGVMTMQNISLSASFYLPLIGSELMNFRFAFCERHQPFTLTVSLFGGGGFFAINLGPVGVVSIEASLEFGASIALDLGVASGQATIMAGFYFKMSGSGFSLTGYFRASGSLSVLGIITVSVEFYLGLTYTTKGMIGEKYPGKLWGQATLTVKIKIVFFSISVGISLERVFAGSDPTFRQLLEPDHWAAYCRAFDDDYPVVPGE